MDQIFQFKDIKKIWFVIRKLIPSEKKNQTILTVKHNDEQTTDPLYIANIFNSYFTGVGESLAVKIR